MPENKENIPETEEIVSKDNINCTASDNHETVDERKEVTKENYSKKESQKENKETKNTRIIKKIIKGTKKGKNEPQRFEEGISIRGKLIGVEDVRDARGDRICQEALQKLKAAVKSSGEHKQKVLLNVSFQGIKITDDKTSELIYHHPVHMISFISLDINDNRAFGYICGTVEEGHKFIGIKTEKAACQVVLTLQDLFQSVLEKKKQAMENAKQLQEKSKPQREDTVDCQVGKKDDLEKKEVNEIIEETGQEKKELEPIYTDVVTPTTEDSLLPQPVIPPPPPPPPPTKSNVDDLFGLQLELDKLQEGIDQMDNSMAAVGVLEQDNPLISDPFNTSTFVLHPQKEIYESTSASTTSSTEDQSVGSPLPDSFQVSQEGDETSTFYVTYKDNDKYSVFSNIDTIPSIFENPQTSSFTTNDGTAADTPQNDVQVLPPPKPLRDQKSLDVFADLDPLGKDRPFLDKKDFFHDIKNPPKKVLKDLIDKDTSDKNETSESTMFYVSSQSTPESTEVSTSYQSSENVHSPFPCDFKNISPPQIPPRSTNMSSSLPTSSVLQVFSSFTVSDSVNKDAVLAPSGNPFKPNGAEPVILHPPPPLPPRLMNRSSEPIIRFSALSKSGNTNYESSNSSSTSAPWDDSVMDQRRGSLPVNQFQSELFCENKSLTVNSSHPIPIPVRKLPQEFQQDFLNSCNGQSLISESNKVCNSLDAESPNKVDFFGHNFGESISNANSNKGISDLGNQDKNIGFGKQNNSSKNQLKVNGISSAHSSTIGKILLPPPESRVTSNRKSNCNKLNGIVKSNSKTSMCSLVVSQFSKSLCESVQVNECMHNVDSVLSCSESSSLHTNNSPLSSSGNIFSRKIDPFADDFFLALPKKLNGYQSVPNEL